MSIPRITLPFLLFVCVGLVAGPVIGQSTTVDDVAASIEIVGPSTAAPGETVTLRVEVTSARPLYAAQFRLPFDETHLQPENVTSGGFLERDEQSILIAADLEAGNVSYGETRIGTDAGVDGTGTLATVSFTVVESAPSQSISLELRDVKLVTPATQPIDTDVRNLTVAITEGSGGDGGSGGQPGDGPQGEVEIRDLSLLDTAVTVDELVVTRVGLTNFDPTEGRLTLTLTANGSVVTERTFTVGAATNRTVRLEHRFAEPGNYLLDVNGARVGTVRVTAMDTPALERTPTPIPERTPTATPTSTGSSTASDTLSGATTPEGSPTASATTTTGNGSGLGVTTAMVAIWLVVFRCSRS